MGSDRSGSAWDAPFGHSDDISDTAVDTEFGDSDYLAALLVTSDNRLLAVGSPITPPVGSIALARYLLGQTPFGGAPVTLPGTIEAENYDLGGEGLAYHDLTPANEGGSYRPAEAVDVQTATGASNGNVLAFARASEWTEYTVDVAKAATVDVAFRYAALKGGGKFHHEVDGRAVTPTLGYVGNLNWIGFRAVATI